MEDFYRCPICGGTLELSEEHERHGKEPFRDVEWNEDKSQYRFVYKCIQNRDYTKYGNG